MPRTDALVLMPFCHKLLDPLPPVCMTLFINAPLVKINVLSEQAYHYSGDRNDRHFIIELDTIYWTPNSSLLRFLSKHVKTTNANGWHYT